MNNIQMFNNYQFGQIRTVEINNEPYFVGTDIAKALGYKNANDAINKHIDSDDKGIAKCDTLGGVQEFTIINESGLYSLIMSSKLPSAKQFKKWVTSEVLPSIRKHGAYMTDEVAEKVIAEPDFLIKLATALKQEKHARELLEKENQEKQILLEAQAPKVIFTDAVMGSNNAILIRDLAKIITQNGHPIGQNRMFGWLRENGYINYYNEPYQRFVEQGLFVRVENVVSHNGIMKTHFTTKVTGKGQVYFVNKFKST